jgi:transcriptional regulator with XRE-family HTH domain
MVGKKGSVKRRDIRTASPILQELFATAYDRKLNDFALADMAGVTAMTIGNWRRGKNEPSIYNAEILADSLGFKLVLVAL